MTDNHNLDRLLLDDLAATVPQADPAFRDRLENQLLAQLQQHVSEQETEAMHMIAIHSRAGQETEAAGRRRAPAPLTLAAALLMVVLAGSALVLMNRPSGDVDLFAAAQQQTPVPAASEDCAPPAGWDQRHTVQEGETALAIVVRYGVDARLFLAANCLDAASALTAGQVVYLPGGGPATPTFTATPLPSPTLLSADTDSLFMTATAVIANATVQPLGMMPVVTATPLPFILPPTIVPPAAGDLSAPGGYSGVVVAVHDIARGTLITDALLAVTYWPPELMQTAVSAPDFSGFYGAVQQAAGLYARVNITRFQPVQAADLTESQLE